VGMLRPPDTEPKLRWPTDGPRVINLLPDCLVEIPGNVEDRVPVPDEPRSANVPSRLPPMPRPKVLTEELRKEPLRKSSRAKRPRDSLGLADRPKKVVPSRPS
jgi:hypothetical protein